MLTLLTISCLVLGQTGHPLVDTPFFNMEVDPVTGENALTETPPPGFEDATFGAEITRDADGNTRIRRPESNHGSELRSSFDLTTGVEVTEETNIRPLAHSNRAPVGYDCTQSGMGNCPDAPVVVTSSTRQFIDWTDSTSYFFPEVRGYLVNDSRSVNYQASITSRNLVQTYARLNQKKRAFYQPVLVLVGGSVFVMSSSQKKFFSNEERVCSSCVNFQPLSSVKSATRRSIELKLQFMKDQDWISDNLVYDTVLFYRRPETWSEYNGVPELSEIVDVATTKLANTLRDLGAPEIYPQRVMQRTALGLSDSVISDFIAEYLLNPHLLQYGQLVGPDPEVSAVPQVPKETPLWVRLRFSEYINDSVGVMGASDAWIAASWRSIKRQCPDCELWDDWFCGSSGEAGIDPTTHRIGCRRLPTPRNEFRLMPNPWLPGDRTPLGMLYTFELRTSISFEEYMRRAGPDPCSPEEGTRGFGPGGRYTNCAEYLYYQERRASYSDTIEANKAVDRFLGITNEYPDINQLLGREFQSNNELIQTYESSVRRTETIGPPPNDLGPTRALEFSAYIRRNSIPRTRRD